MCGMELVPVKASAGGEGDEYGIDLEPVARRLANIKTVPAERRRVYRSIRTVGEIDFDESRLATIAAYVAGRIEKLFADYTGIDVTEGDHMVVLYSPELYAAQVEYLVTRKTAQRMGGLAKRDTADSARRFALNRSRADTALPHSGDASVRPTSATRLWTFQSDMVEDAREKLRELGMTDRQIVELEARGQAQTRLRICAPIGGTVIAKLRQEGDYVKAGDPIYRIADLSVVWLMLELFPDDASQVRYGQKVEVRVDSLPNEVFTGRVAFIDPVVDPKTRTVSVRVEMVNPDRRLRPGDYATATIKVPITPDGRCYDPELAGKWIGPCHPQILQDRPGRCPVCDSELLPTSRFGYDDEPRPSHRVLVVPRDALLMVGDHSVVYVETKPGRFEIRPVTVGALTDDEAVILSGVEEGEQVATSGNFLIDSQMQLAGKPCLIDPSRAIEQDEGPERSSEPSGPPSLDGSGLMAEGQTPEALPIGAAEAAHAVSAGSSLSENGATILSDELGQTLDKIFRCYFAIQQALAADREPAEADGTGLRRAAQQLLGHESAPETLREDASAIIEHAEHLHGPGLAEARQRFKPISHAVIRMARRFRGPGSQTDFVHFHCPMVEGGGGDWLQVGGPLANPYFGSQMLRCGRKVAELKVSEQAPRVADEQPERGLKGATRR
ncbi:MAG: DUF3347 domain-containing protein [Planctomycetes bacterium]|nr:DUF3347 domain-containing protein [Planctomycetota bacterium]